MKLLTLALAVTVVSLAAATVLVQLLTRPYAVTHADLDALRQREALSQLS